MRVSHGYSVAFDDPNLVSCAGLAPVLELAERAGLQNLVAELVRIGKAGGARPELKIPSLVAGMIAGADSIDDMAVLRHGAMSKLFDGVRAPSTLGTFLRTFTFGHVRQLDAVASRVLISLTKTAPLLPGIQKLAYVDVDDTVQQTYGYAKQGAGRGYTGLKGLNVLLGILSTPDQPATDHRREAPSRTHQQREGRAPAGLGQPGDRQGLRRWRPRRDVGAAGGLGVLPVRRHRRGAAPEGVLLNHRPTQPARPQSHRRHR